jgi:hypothetical protein
MEGVTRLTVVPLRSSLIHGNDKNLGPLSAPMPELSHAIGSVGMCLLKRAHSTERRLERLKGPVAECQICESRHAVTHQQIRAASAGLACTLGRMRRKPQPAGHHKAGGLLGNTLATLSGHPCRPRWPHLPARLRLVLGEGIQGCARSYRCVLQC